MELRYSRGCENNTPPIEHTLPSGAGTITVTVDGVYTITISWAENRDENNDGVSDITSFQTSFKL